MPRTRSNEYGYIEWGEGDTAAAKARARDSRAPAESLFDAEIRRRFGETIARAVPAALAEAKKRIRDSGK